MARVGISPGMTRKTLFLTWLFCLFAPAALAQTSWEWKPNSLELRGEGITFEWAVPKLLQTPGDTAHWQKLLDKKVRDNLNAFQSAFLDAQKELAEDRKTNPEVRMNSWESSGGYQAVWQDDRHLVLLWTGYDYRGGAHGLPVLEVTVLSTEQSDSLRPPSSLFSDHTEALKALSSASREALAVELGGALDDWALQGTEPEWANFSVVYPTREDGPARFEVIFPSYQVAPYAVGTPTVTIPWETLSRWTPGLHAGAAQP
jgi:hypothetical protein